MTPGLKSLDTILKECGIALELAQVENLWRYHRMLRQANPVLNLTRIHNFENMVVKHYVDSLLVLKYLSLPDPLVDMGSGAGLPGIPLKIARPELRMILAEPRGARAAFLREVCAHLALERVEIFDHKIGEDFPERVGGVISRAVGPIPETLDRVMSCLGPGGRMIFMKGPHCDLEVDEAVKSRGEFFSLEADHAYTIPGTTHHRRLVVFERLETEKTPRLSQPPVNRLSDTSARLSGVRARELTSAGNPTFQLCRDVLTGPGIREHGQAILSGARARAEVVARFPDRVLGWLTDPEGPPPPEGPIDCEWLRFSRPLFKQLDVVGTHGPLLLVKVPEMTRWSDDLAWPRGCTLFVPFQDPEHVGAVIRSAAAFGAARVVLLREAAHPFLPRASRAAGPALFQVVLLTGPSSRNSLLQLLRSQRLDTTGQELEATPFPERFGLVVGTEGRGLTECSSSSSRRRIAIVAGRRVAERGHRGRDVRSHAWARQREK